MNANLSPALVQFVTGHLSIHVATCCGDGLTTLVRGVGARIDPTDARFLRILVPRSQSAELLDAIEAQYPVAAVFNEPETHRTVQLKAPSAEVVAADDDDRALHTPYVRAMVERLRAFDTPAPYVYALLSCAQDDLVAIRFSPQDVFGQTPGPRAGAPIPADGPVP